MVVGTKCPAIGGLTFIKGDPLRIGGDATPGPLVLEFWATWCGPCVQTVPHLTELQHKYKGKLTVVGISQEQDAGKVKRFVEGKGSTMDYTVAVDTAGATEELMAKAGVRGIPHAFVVDATGTITFSGHPMEPGFESKVQAAVEAAKPAQVPLPLITESYEELMAKSVKELKTILSERGISMVGAAEKSDLARLVVEKASTVTYYKSA